MKTLEDLNLEREKVLVRVDFNVSLNEKGEILGDERIRMVLPTIDHLMEKGAKITLVSHLGRPKKREGRLSLAPVAKRLAEMSGYEVALFDIVSSTNVLLGRYNRRGRERGTLILLENLRFSEGEEKNDSDFVQMLAKFGRMFVQDAFSSCHKKHASIVGLPRILPSCSGLLMEKEVEKLSGVIKDPKRPFVVIMGGKKVDTKARAIESLLEIADELLVGELIGKEIKENGIFLKHPEKLVAPVDSVNGRDLGPQTIEIFKKKIRSAGTVFWNGPVGEFEKDSYCLGTKEIAKAVASSGYSVAGGGETMEAIKSLGLLNEIDHVSTGGGATL